MKRHKTVLLLFLSARNMIETKMTAISSYGVNFFFYLLSIWKQIFPSFCVTNSTCKLTFWYLNVYLKFHLEKVFLEIRSEINYRLLMNFQCTFIYFKRRKPIPKYKRRETTISRLESKEIDLWIYKMIDWNNFLWFWIKSLISVEKYWFREFFVATDRNHPILNSTY